MNRFLTLALWLLAPLAASAAGMILTSSDGIINLRTNTVTAQAFALKKSFTTNYTATSANTILPFEAKCQFTPSETKPTSLIPMLV